MACYGCKEALTNEWAIRAADQIFHVRCFQCVNCKRQGLDKSTAESVMDLLCAECQQQKVTTFCYGCQKPIESQFYKRVNKRAYHFECLICAGCRYPFSEDEKECYPIDGKYYCLQCHYNERSAKYLRGEWVPLPVKKK